MNTIPTPLLILVLICSSFKVCNAQQTQIDSDFSGNRQTELSNRSPLSPLITSQPVTQLGQLGRSYAFTVSATGLNLSYQWYKDGSSISGATSNTFVVSSAQSVDFSNHSAGTGFYTVKVTNSSGTVTSSEAALYLDTYQDGIPDWWQQQYFGAIYNPANPSIGGQPPSGYYTGSNGTNTVTNAQAYQDGTDPTNPATSEVTLSTIGPVAVTPLLPRYPIGSTVTLSPSSGYLQNWLGDAAGSTVPLKVLMNRNKSIQAVTTPMPNARFATTLATAGAQINALLVQADGSLITGGNFTSFLGSPQWNLGRITPSGALDTSYFPGSRSKFNGQVNGVVQQSDGRLIVVGNFSSSNSVNGVNPPKYIARLNADGTLDPSFMANGLYPNNVVNAVAVQSNGQIIIAGYFSSIGQTTVNGIARLNTDGSLDANFNTGTGFYGIVNNGCLAIDSSGNVYAGGSLYQFNGATVSNLIRIKSNGALDTGFNTGSGFNSAVSAFALKSNGGLYVGGSFSKYNNSTVPSLIALTSTGSLDGSFDAGSGTSFPQVNGLGIQANGSVVAGLSGQYWGNQTVSYTIRLSSSGILDNTFVPQLDGPVQQVRILSSGQIILGGSFAKVGGVAHYGLARLNADGSLDATANWNVGLTYSYPSVVVAQQADGKLLLSGSFSLVGNTPANGFVRINIDGSPDTSFNIGSGLFGTINSIIPQSSGKIVVVGYLSQYNGNAVHNCLRLNNDGSIDTNFSTNLGQGPSGTVYAGAQQSNGQLVIGGSFSSVNGNSRKNLARLNGDGSLDQSFRADTDQNVSAIALDSQGNILVGGSFSIIGGSGLPDLARLNPDGTIDQTFSPPAPNGSVNQIAVASNGQIVILGNFTQIGNINQSGLARFNQSGSLDPTLGQASYGLTSRFALSADGSVFVGGNATQGSVSYVNLLHILANGFLDASFNPQPNSTVNQLLIGTSGDLFAFGPFSTDVSEYACGIAHYSSTPGLGTSLAGISPSSSVTPGTPVSIFGTAASTLGTVSVVTYQYSTDNLNFQTAAVGSPVGTNQYSGVWAPPSAGTYYLRMLAADSYGESATTSAVAFTATSGSPQIANPTLSLASGTFTSPQTVTVSSSTPGVQIFYTTDGTNPATSSTKQFLGSGGTLTLAQTTALTLEAFYQSGASAVTSALYTINNDASGSLVSTDTPTLPTWGYTLLVSLLISLGIYHVRRAPTEVDIE